MAGVVEVLGWALGHAATFGRFADGDLASILAAPSWIVDVDIIDASRASLPAQGPSTTPLPTNPRRLNK